MENGTQMTLGEFMPEIFQTQTVGASDSLVRTSQSQESSLDLLETARHSFSELCTFLDSSKKKRDPLTYSLRTLKICLVLMEDGISPDFSLKWIGGGTMRSGVFSTVNTSESHKTGNDVLLSDILEVEVPQKYFLSKEQTERIVFTESDTKTDTAETRKSSIGGGITEALDTAAGGGRGHHTIETIGINTMDDGSCRTIKNQYQKNSVANFTQQGSRGATCAGIEIIGKAYERDNYGDNRNRILGEGGVSPSLTATQYKEPYRVGLSLSETRIRQAEG